MEYRQHFKRIWKQLPIEGRKLPELDLHDAELLNADKVIAPLIKSKFEKSATPAISFAPALLALKQDDHLVTLIYVLSGRVSTHAPRAKWPFAKSRPHWLYNEVDLDSGQGGAFVHRVFISDGRVLEIPFSSVGIQRTPWSPVSSRKLARTSA